VEESYSTTVDFADAALGLFHMTGILHVRRKVCLEVAGRCRCGSCSDVVQFRGRSLHVSVAVSVSVCVSIYPYSCSCSYMCLCICICPWGLSWGLSLGSVSVSVCVCMCVCLCFCLYICIHTRIHADMTLLTLSKPTFRCLVPPHSPPASPANHPIT
jgi:hypothetical protein